MATQSRDDRLLLRDEHCDLSITERAPVNPFHQPAIYTAYNIDMIRSNIISFLTLPSAASMIRTEKRNFRDCARNLYRMLKDEEIHDRYSLFEFSRIQDEKVSAGPYGHIQESRD